MRPGQGRRLAVTVVALSRAVAEDVQDRADAVHRTDVPQPPAQDPACAIIDPSRRPAVRQAQTPDASAAIPAHTVRDGWQDSAGLGGMAATRHRYF